MKFVLSLISTYALLLVCVYFLQEKLLFFYDKNGWDQCDFLAIKGFSPYTIKKDNITISGWVKNPQAKELVFLFHGNGGFACHREYWLPFLEGSERGIVFVEYPGYNGQPISYNSILESALANYDHFVSPRVDKIFVVGESLGTGPATYLASKRPVTKLLLNAPYRSITHLAQSKFWFLPAKLILKYPFPAFRWAPHVKAPVLIIHGRKDEVIPFAEGQIQSKFFSDAKVLELQNAHHNDWIEHIEKKQFDKINQFFTH